MSRWYRSARRMVQARPWLRRLVAFLRTTTRIRQASVPADYASRLAAETRIYKDVEDINALPPIFHYWSNRHLRPMLEPFGFSNPDQFFAKYLHESALACGADRAELFEHRCWQLRYRDSRRASPARCRFARGLRPERCVRNPDQKPAGDALAVRHTEARGKADTAQPVAVEGTARPTIVRGTPLAPPKFAPRFATNSQRVRGFRNALVLAALAPSLAYAVQSVTLPGWVCAHPDAILVSGFESGESPVPHAPSGGSGGAFPGSVTRSLHIAGLGTGTQTYYLYLPPDYTPARPWPLLLALHGVAPWANRAAYAAAVLSDWAGIAAGAGFLVAAPVANRQVTVNGTPVATWAVPPSSGPTDYDLFAAILTDLDTAYNIDHTRLYGWGFSAGGHVMHDLGINTYSAAFNASTLAAYSVSAGDLAALACQGLSNGQCNALLAALPRKIPVDIHIGTSDPNYPYAQSDHARFVAQGWVDGQTIDYNTFNGGHSYSVSDLQLAWSDLCRAAVVP